MLLERAEQAELGELPEQVVGHDGRPPPDLVLGDHADVGRQLADALLCARGSDRDHGGGPGWRERDLDVAVGIAASASVATHRSLPI